MRETSNFSLLRCWRAYRPLSAFLWSGFSPHPAATYTACFERLAARNYQGPAHDYLWPAGLKPDSTKHRLMVLGPCQLLFDPSCGRDVKHKMQGARTQLQAPALARQSGREVPDLSLPRIAPARARPRHPPLWRKSIFCFFPALRAHVRTWLPIMQPQNVVTRVHAFRAALRA